ncbi:phenylalanine--tRNA ligase subunit alpha [Granulicella sp. dw_53]|uniref:phenylalanine--tRNA ligase subunit alpha n=1 Tax=Granulicella sp. dw_53 TaxID=2719792 RepID=UPI001BD1DA61|nr:phenylalanine--tRNA ligase subunit alpha [Granulicella sp. dw_53]
MNDTIPQLRAYDEATLEAAFATLIEEVRSETSLLQDPESFRLHWLGRKQGRLKLISEAWLKSAPPEARKPLGIQFNRLKQEIEAALEAPAAADSAAHTEQGIDITLPGTQRAPGIAHPLLKTMEQIVQVFHNLGYSTNLGPQVESDFYNFEALNFPPNHPARDTQDTLVIANQQNRPSRDRLLMRTHTSPVQIRTMVAQAPPIRIVIPGKVHRNDAADATHSPIFHQVEGLCVDTNITFSDLKGTLDHAMKALFGSDVKTRFFPSFFPFTEPSADVQISCIFCGGKGCRKCKHSGWIELLGCGMVDPAVFAAVTKERRKLGLDDDAYDPNRITGFAFGMGVERIAMIQHGISDIGHFFSGDMRFLEQFA